MKVLKKDSSEEENFFLRRAVKSPPKRRNAVFLTEICRIGTAFPYQEKGHGMFTYFLLKKLRESKGNCTLGELSDYITTKVQQQSVVVNRKSQTPTINVATALQDSWKDMKLK
ncbi:MAG: hypothetical protein IKZ62_05965 [Prevotella sp.]|nr:hypothetical protein [Prevotella sp.]